MFKEIHFYWPKKLHRNYLQNQDSGVSCVFGYFWKFLFKGEVNFIRNLTS